MQKKRGFTLVELIIVLVILAILVSLALPTFMGARQRAYRAEALQILAEMKTLAWGYNLENGGLPDNPNWPTSLNSMGYNLGAPNTTNWGFQVAGPYTTNVGNANCTISIEGCFRARAVTVDDSPTEGLKNISLLIDPKGNSAILED